VVLLILAKNTVHNEEELRKTLNTPCLGQIPSVKLTKKAPHPLVHRRKSDSGFGESVRLLLLRVEKAMEEENKKVLLVSSAVPGEGKTTVSVNLAAALAQKGKRVLLVDCDLRNPSVVKTLSTKNCPVGNEKSIVDYMGGKVTVIDMIQPTDQENLFVISGGPGKTADYTAMLSHERMARLIQAGRNLYDYVILDTPPCSLLTDAAEVAEYAEAGLIVIRQDYAARDQIVDGIQRLGDSKLPIIGCVLNNVHKSLSGGYGYAYGYRYGYGKKR
jgi:receptor protein-tyrosine kinase